MHGVVKHLGKNMDKCDMCSASGFRAVDKYIYLTYEILPKLPSRELEICKKCAIRELGSKNKSKFDEIIKKRGERYGNSEKTI